MFVASESPDLVAKLLRNCDTETKRDRNLCSSRESSEFYCYNTEGDRISTVSQASSRMNDSTRIMCLQRTGDYGIF